MADGRQIDQKLEELRRVTGLSLEIADLSGEDGEDAEEKVAMLLSAWKDKYDRSGFIRGLLTGTADEKYILAHAPGFHIPCDGRRRIYAIECAGRKTGEALKVLRAMFIRRTGDLAETVDSGHLVLIRPVGNTDSEEEARKLARTIVDMLGAEAMVSARVGYADPVDSLAAFAEGYREALRALEIGALFNSMESVFPYRELGIGRLVYDLPEETCRVFLNELFGSEEGLAFDEDGEALIEAFFENNLNIAETARHLFLHRNTLVYRLEKLRADTGLDLRNFEDAQKLNLARMIGMRLKASRYPAGVC